MKLTVCLSASLIALLAFPAGVRAAAPDATVNPYANVDPDGVPIAVNQSAANQSREGLSPEQIDALDKQQAEEDARSRNWLLFEYEQQFRRSNAESSLNDKTLNMYLQLSMNRDLADVAGQLYAEANATPPPSLHATPKISSPNGMALRPDAAPAKGIFSPLISPLSSPTAVAATQPFYASAYSASLPANLAPITSLDAPPAASVPAPAPNPTPASLPTSPTDTVDMQTPGLIADKTTPLPGGPDLDLALPDQNGDNAQNQQQADQPAQLPQLPQVMDAGLMHEELNAKLDAAKGPQANAKSQTPKPTAANPPPPEVPSPISQQPQLSPVHAPIPNPFDILNH